MVLLIPLVILLIHLLILLVHLFILLFSLVILCFSNKNTSDFERTCIKSLFLSIPKRHWLVTFQGHGLLWYVSYQAVWCVIGKGCVTQVHFPLLETLFFFPKIPCHLVALVKDSAIFNVSFQFGTILLRVFFTKQTPFFMYNYPLNFSLFVIKIEHKVFF